MYKKKKTFQENKDESTNLYSMSWLSKGLKIVDISRSTVISLTD